MHIVWKWMICFIVMTPSVQAVTLDQALREALQKNETVEQNKNKVSQAEDRLSQAKGAILPNIALNGTYFVQPELGDPIAREIFPNQQTTVNLTVTQPI